MATRKIESLLAWFRRNYDKIKDDTYGWCNISKILSENDVKRIEKFCEKRSEVDFLLIIKGVNTLRPQRTWDGLPEWLRNNTIYHHIYYDTNSFVFISCVKEDSEEIRTEKKKLVQNARDIVDECGGSLLFINYHNPENEKENILEYIGKGKGESSEI